MNQDFSKFVIGSPAPAPTQIPNLSASKVGKPPPGKKDRASLSQTLGALTVSSACHVAITGTCSQTLGALTVVGSATATDSGSLNQTLGAISISASGAVAVQSSLSQALGALSVSASGTVAVQATSSETLGELTASASAAVEVQAQLSQTLEALSLDGTATVTGGGISATLDETLDPLQISATATAAQPTQQVFSGGGGGPISRRFFERFRKKKKKKKAEDAAECPPIQARLSASLGSLTVIGRGTCRNSGTVAQSLGALGVRSSARVSCLAKLEGQLWPLECRSKCRVSPMPVAENLWESDDQICEELTALLLMT